MDSVWYLAYSRPYKEESLNSFLQSQDFETFYPVIVTKPVNPRAAKRKPFFPRYLFVHLDPDDPRNSFIHTAPGLHHIVSFGDEPAHVSDEVIQVLQQRMTLMELPGIYRVVEFRTGDEVRVIQGPFKGYNALFDMHINGEERVQILLQTLNTPFRIQVHVTDIEKTASYN